MAGDAPCARSFSWPTAWITAFAASGGPLRSCARGGRAAAGGGSGGGGGGCGSIHDAAPPKKLRAKKQVAQAAIEAGAEREFQARYDDHQNEKEQMFVRLGMSQYYGSEG